MEPGSVHPLALLTRDGWIHVLAGLNKPQDRWNAANAHPLFWAIFQSDLSEKWLSAMFFGCIPYLLNYLPFRKVLELRLVSQETRSTVDHCLEQGQVFALKNYTSKLCLSLRDLHPNEDEQGIEVSTPHITRWMNLQLWCTDIPDCFEDVEPIVPFFRQYGPQVVKVVVGSLEYNGQPERILHQMAFLRSLLIFTPNAMELELHGYSNNSEQIMAHRSLADLFTGFLRDNPFPPLHSLANLAALSRWPQREISAVIGTFLQCYGSQIHRLDLSGSTAILPKPMLHLRVLLLYLETTEQLSSLQACGAPLEVLNVHILENSPILPSRFFLALQPFQTTLIKLTLHAEQWEFCQVEQLWVELPLVEKLSLTGVFKGCTGDGLYFLNSFRNLKKLRINIVHSELGRFENTIYEDSSSSKKEPYLYLSSFYSPLLDGEHLYRTSIWTRLLRLQKVRICVDFKDQTIIDSTFSRDTWSTTGFHFASDNQE